jgi:WD40 repeat protein
MALAFMPDGRLLLAVSQLLGVEVWSGYPDSDMHREFQVRYSQPLTVALHPIRGWVAVTMGPEAGDLQVWDLETNSLREEVPAISGLNPQFAHKATLLLFSDWSAYIWDVEADEQVAATTIDTGGIDGPRVPYVITVSYDDTLFATGTSIPFPGIGVWEIPSARPVGIIPHDNLENVRQLSFSSVSSDIAIGLTDGLLQIWHTDL